MVTSPRSDFIDSPSLCSTRKCQLMLIMFLRSSGNESIISFNLFLSWIWVISFRCRSSLSISSILFFIFNIISTISTSSLPFSHSCMFCNKHRKLFIVILYFGTFWLRRVLTMCDRASSWRTLSFLAIDWYRVLYQPLKFGDLKNRRYRPSQLPLTLDVKWGPEDSRDAIKSSGLNGNGRGALCKIKI